MKAFLLSVFHFVAITRCSAQRGGHDAGRVCDEQNIATLSCYQQDQASFDICAKCYVTESWACDSISSSVQDINQQCVNAGKCASDCSVVGKAMLECIMEYQCGDERSLAMH
ncbi:hypothetical protein HJC23_004770 [Cyclotella cryptica]|uniref:Uncharacterized protein n=1 Tax=Cyclotella cryptica TaxID=29204 RepID=A0ABD3PCB4_9STRA|eukprot:CCRYP_015897-RA/>CCRYP_015897-RA protein AED:0.33 eAED:0.33 QI:0/-1/0/1/-1/1/1/0/111